MLFGGNSWPSIAFKLWMMLWQLWWWSNVVAVVLPVETALSTIGTGKQFITHNATEDSDGSLGSLSLFFQPHPETNRQCNV